MKTALVILIMVLSSSVQLVVGKQLSEQDTPLSGDWKGQSICENKQSACRDEVVVYHITHDVKSGNVTVNADKIVDGKAIAMGELIFSYDENKKILTGKGGNNRWQFTVTGNRMEGILLRDGSLFRRVTLTKES